MELYRKGSRNYLENVRWRQAPLGTCRSQKKKETKRSISLKGKCKVRSDQRGKGPGHIRTKSEKAPKTKQNELKKLKRHKQTDEFRNAFKHIRKRALKKF